MEELKEYLQTIADLNYLIIMLHWERDTIAPEKSLDYLVEVQTKLEMKVFNLTTDDKYKKLLASVINSNDFKKLSYEEQTYLKDLLEEFDRFKRIPKELYEEYCNLTGKSVTVWADAKEKNNYEIFKPYLSKIIDMSKKMYSYTDPDKDMYNAMLNDYEKGLNKEFIDKLFDELKKGILPIVKQLKKKDLPKINNTYTDSELTDISEYLLDYIGFDNTRGALGIFPHGYTTTLNRNDIRIAFSQNKNITDHCATIIHEGGHGIFEQNLGKELYKYPTYDINKIALHESQSRFYENMLGRNINFWEPIYDEIKDKLKTKMTLEEYIEYFNNAYPSKIRTEADELTYCLHIIIRYEIERELFDNKITIDELPSAWNKKYKEYLGVDIKEDKDGVLQDMHWSDGSFGYFPSYLLGSIFDGMLLETINEKIGNVDNLLKEGKIKEITKFLNENIHQYGGTYNINEVAKRVCGKELTVEPLINYFKQKYEEE
jgi:carboxypeptidase Taq